MNNYITLKDFRALTSGIPEDTKIALSCFNDDNPTSGSLISELHISKICDEFDGSVYYEVELTPCHKGDEVE